jgi:hypothetical protein
MKIAMSSGARKSCQKNKIFGRHHNIVSAHIVSKRLWRAIEQMTSLFEI